MNTLILSSQGITPKKTITSLELVERINLFRKEEGKDVELQHKTMLAIIRDEFEEEKGNIFKTRHSSEHHKRRV